MKDDLDFVFSERSLDEVAFVQRYAFIGGDIGQGLLAAAGVGTLGIVDGLSAPGLSLTLRSEVDTLVLVSNCPQINNPCNGFNPTPIRMIIAP